MQINFESLFEQVEPEIDPQYTGTKEDHANSLLAAIAFAKADGVSGYELVETAIRINQRDLVNGTAGTRHISDRTADEQVEYLKPDGMDGVVSEADSETRLAADGVSSSLLSDMQSAYDAELLDGQSNAITTAEETTTSDPTSDDGSDPDDPHGITLTGAD